MRVCCTTFHAINSGFQPNGVHDTRRRHPILMKKLLKIDDVWSNQNVILGWLLDNASITIALPPHHQELVLTILPSIV